MRRIRLNSLHRFSLPALLLLTSCTTIPPYKKIRLPAFVGSYLSECTGKDGTVSIELSEAGKIVQILDADWTTEASGNWGVASYSPLGQTLFQIEYNKNSSSLRKTGQQAEGVNKLDVSKEGILTFDGHEVGLRADEVGCVLSQKIPQKWISQVVGEKVEKESLVYIIRDKNRTINLTIGKHGSRNEFSWKADIEWPVYLGLQKVRVSMGLLRSEQALLLRSDRFENRDCRIVIQEE